MTLGYQTFCEKMLVCACVRVPECDRIQPSGKGCPGPGRGSFQPGPAASIFGGSEAAGGGALRPAAEKQILLGRVHVDS